MASDPRSPLFHFELADERAWFAPAKAETVLDRRLQHWLGSLVGVSESNSTSLRRKHAFGGQPFAEFDGKGLVNAEQSDSDPADRRAADEDGPLPTEVPCPLVSAGVEERCELSGLPIPAANI